jgi:hypothetical protein
MVVGEHELQTFVVVVVVVVLTSAHPLLLLNKWFVHIYLNIKFLLSKMLMSTSSFSYFPKHGSKGLQVNFAPPSSFFLSSALLVVCNKTIQLPQRVVIYVVNFNHDFFTLLQHFGRALSTLKNICNAFHLVCQE